jgi:hypothetical protein
MTVRVRKLGRRVAARGSWLSEEPVWREYQLRFLGISAFSALCVGALVVRKLTCASGPVLAAGAGVVLAGLGALVLRTPKAAPEPADEELALAPVEIEERLSAATLRPEDLVYEGDQWRTLLESAQFGELAERPFAARQRTQRLVMAGVIAAVLAVVLGAAVALGSARNPLGWLLQDDC